MTTLTMTTHSTYYATDSDFTPILQFEDLQIHIIDYDTMEIHLDARPELHIHIDRENIKRVIGFMDSIKINKT
jgi:hypothetical protein